MNTYSLFPSDVWLQIDMHSLLPFGFGAISLTIRIPCRISQTPVPVRPKSESPVWCQNLLYSRSEPLYGQVRLPSIVSQNPLHRRSVPSQNPLYGQSQVRIPCMVSQTPVRIPVWCQNPLYGQSVIPVRIAREPHIDT